MTRADLDELGYIVPIASVPSILELGILSHRRAKKIQHFSIADQKIQGLRANAMVPNGRPLHEYANLYICPRNPMLYRRSDLHDQICVLRIDAAVLDMPGVIVTDSNAASGYVRFSPAPAGLAIVNRERTFARYWTHPEDQREEWRHSIQKCAEVLVPNSVPPEYIMGAYASCEASRDQLAHLAPHLAVTVNADLFFRVR